MSLVGLNVSFEDAGIDLQPTNHSESYDDEDDEEQSAHPCVTPKGPAELLFFCDLPTHTISAAALAQQIHNARGQRSRSSARSYTTDGDDFATAAGTVSSDMLFSPPSASNHGTNDVSPSSSKSLFSERSSSSIDDDGANADDSHQHRSPSMMFHQDVLTQTCVSTTMNNHRHHHEQDEIFQDSRMTTTPAKKFFPTEAPQHVDAAEKVYDTAKNVWAWGKGVGIIKPFLNLAEHLADKAASATGNTLESVDGIVIDQLHGFDDNLLNPAIAALVGILLNAAGKSEEVLKPLLIPLLLQFKLIKKDGEAVTAAVAEKVTTPMKKETPEVTPDVVAFASPIATE
jgi:hypothetical protein